MPKYSETVLSRCHILQHKFHTDFQRVILSPRGGKMTIVCLSQAQPGTVQRLPFVNMAASFVFHKKREVSWVSQRLLDSQGPLSMKFHERYNFFRPSRNTQGASISHYEIKVKVTVKWSRYRPGVAQRLGRGIVLLFHDRGTRRGLVVSSTPRLHFTPGKDPVPISWGKFSQKCNYKCMANRIRRRCQNNQSRKPPLNIGAHKTTHLQSKFPPKPTPT